MKQFSRIFLSIWILGLLGLAGWLVFQSDEQSIDTDNEGLLENAVLENSSWNDNTSDDSFPEKKIAEEPLHIHLKEGTQLGFNVLRSQLRTGRFEGGDTTEIDYKLKVDRLKKDGALDLEVLLERIRFQRTGRAPIEFDSADQDVGEPVLKAALRGIVNKPLRVTVDVNGKVGEVADFPEPWVQPQRPGAEKTQREIPERMMLRALQEMRFKRMASLMLRFVISPKVLRTDLQTFFAAGIQGRELKPGMDYSIVVPDGAPRGRRLQHPGRAPIYTRSGHVPDQNPFFGEGNGKGRGGYILKFAGSKTKIQNTVYEFTLLQSYGPQYEDPSFVPVVGSASFRKSDGLLENLAYLYELNNNVPRDSYSLSLRIDISRK